MFWLTTICWTVLSIFCFHVVAEILRIEQVNFSGAAISLLRRFLYSHLVLHPELGVDLIRQWRLCVELVDRHNFHEEFSKVTGE